MCGKLRATYDSVMPYEKQTIDELIYMVKRILVIGAVPHKDNLKTYGGTTTLMQNFIDFCHERNYPIFHIDTFHFANKYVNAFYFAVSFLWGLLTCRVVMYNASVNGAFSLFYYTAPLAYAMKRKVVFRKYGGNFLQQMAECPASKRLRMLRLLNRASALFYETKVMVNESRKLFVHPERIHWFPNCRKPTSIAVRGLGYRKRFVFISHIREEKGVDIILDAADRLPEDFTVHLYGSIYDKKYTDDYFAGHGAEYCGPLSTEEVLPTLAGYDVLLLPTYCRTEGYPGIIIEALSLGMPVISTSIGGIPEMVNDGENGFLIEPKDAKSLARAMLDFNEQNYKIMSQAAKSSFDRQFNSEVRNEQVYQVMISS